MRPRTVALLALTAGLLAAAPAAEAARGRSVASKPRAGALYTEGPSHRYQLNARWLFRHDPADAGLAQRWQRQESISGWRIVSVPNAWNATDLSDASQAGSVGWYRRDFRLPTANQHLRWIVRFESVNHRARVWLNGNPIGSHTGPYLPFELNLPRIKRSGINRLVIRVDNRRLPNDLPPGELTRFGTPGGGWWNDGGILREVYLRSVHTADMRTVVVRPILKCGRCAAKVRFTVRVRNVTERARRMRIRGTFGDRPVDLGKARVPAFGFQTFRREIRIRKAKLWSPGRPYLYPVRLRLSEGSRRLQSYAVLTGIRSIRTDSTGRLYLNGRRLRVSGASMHEDHPTMGAALSGRERAINISLLKRLSANVTRSHYPLHPHTLEMADRRGILVWNQVPVYQLSVRAFADPAIRATAVRAFEEMVRRDINHASVFVWSIGNELPARPGEGQQLYIRKAITAARKLDPDRLVGLDVAGYPSIEKQMVYRKLDAIGINDYFGWYPGPNGQLLGRQELPRYLDQMHRYYPSEALFVTEVGAEANRHGPIDEKGTYEFQSDFLRYHLQAIGTKPYMNGAILWILKDFRVRPDWDGGNPKPEPPWNQKGILDQFGQPKPVATDIADIFRVGIAKRWPRR